MKLFLTVVACLLSLSFAGAQTAASSSAATRLQQLDATYQTNLRKLHAPVLTDYIRELELLKQTLTTRGRTGDAQFVDTEITRVRGLATTTGILTEPKKEEPPAAGLAAADPAMSKPPKPPGLKKLQDGIILNISDALPSTEFPLVVRDGPARALQIGRASWKVPSVPAGTYELLVFYAASKVAAGQNLTARFNGTDLSFPLTPDLATTTDQNFRVARLGKVTLDAELNNATLTLRIDPFDTPALWIRSVVFAKPRPPVKP